MTATGAGDATVAVVGGGIAGAGACIALCGRGLTPVWFAPTGTGDGERPGESLAPAAAPLLRRLGVEDLLVDSRHRAANTTFSAWGSERLVERSAIVHLEGPGRVLDRAAFEADLAAAAEGRGARWLDTGLKEVSREGDCWRLTGDDGRVVTADQVLDASGRAAVVARDLATRYRADRQVAAFAFLEQADTEITPTPATLIEAAPDGWWYAALLADRRLVVNYYSDPDLLPAGLSRDLGAWRDLLCGTRYIAQWIDSAGFAVAAPPRLASAGTTWIAPAAGNGWAAAGDAAAGFDPLSSHGMTTALWTGVAAAEALAAAGGGDPAALPAYAEKVARGVHDFLATRPRIYAQEARWRDRPFWRRRRLPAGQTGQAARQE